MIRLHHETLEEKKCEIVVLKNEGNDKYIS